MKTNTKILPLIYIISLLLNFIVITPTQACACGMLVSQKSKTIEMKGERGLVVYDSKTKNEQLAIDFQLEGTSGTSALVVPTPVKAEINQIKKEVFEDLEDIVNPPRKSEMMVTGNAFGSADNVEVLERKEVGNFEIAALKANSFQDLFAWTDSNGFKLEKEAENPIRSFIEANFVLNVIKLKKKADKSDINPLLFTFKAEKLFYPLMEIKDGRDDQKDKSLDLYLLTDYKTDFIGLANVSNMKFSKEDLEDEITQTDENDFKNVEFEGENYYLTFIKTDNYGKEEGLISSLGNPQMNEYQSLNLGSKSTSPWFYILIVTVILEMIILSVLAYILIRFLPKIKSTKK